MKAIKTLTLPCFAMFWLCAGFNWIIGGAIVLAMGIVVSWKGEIFKRDKTTAI